MRRKMDGWALPLVHINFTVLVSQICNFVLMRYEAKGSSELKGQLTFVISIVFASGNYCTKLNNRAPLFDAPVFVHVKYIMNSTE